MKESGKHHDRLLFKGLGVLTHVLTDDWKSGDRTTKKTAPSLSFSEKIE
jgi:hypothetical protein